MKNMNNERNLKEKRNNKRKTNDKYRYYTSYYDDDYYGNRTLDDNEIRNIKVVEIW